ncbi:hypothetical protein ACWEP5_22250 [Nocardia niigatensis]
MRSLLETSTEGNVRFHQRPGFEVTAAITLSGNALRTWCMREDAE